MRTSSWWAIIAILVIVIAVLSWFLFMTPAPSTSVNATSTGTVATTTGSGAVGTTTALHDRVVVDAPKRGQTVFKTFTVTGKAPGNWFFEASFPIEVLDPQGNTVATGHGNALSDWMTTADVPFKADIKIASYTGPATLIIMRDNPSGLPQNDDSVSIPIVIQ